MMSDLHRLKYAEISDELYQENIKLRADLAAACEERDAYRNTANGWECVCRDTEARMSKLDFERTAAELRAEAAEAREHELREALNRVLIGGNHIALLIGADHPLYTATHEEAMAHYRNSRNTYEIWCCWKTMMEAGNTLDRIDAALGKEP